jgi:hypothetical protein
VVVVQGFLLEHELEHALSGDEESCLVCQLAGHQGDALVDTPPASVPAIAVAAEQASYHHFYHSHLHHFSARAPPLPIAL